MAVTPVLKRFDTYVYKRRSGSPAAIVPAQATIDFYLQGATLRTAVVVGYTDPSLVNPDNPDPPPATPVDVYHVGAIQPFNDLRYEFGAAMVASTTDAANRVVYLWNTSVQPSLTLELGKRLICLSDRPLAHVDPLGVVNTGLTSTITTDGATGRAGCYIRAYRYDFTITGTGVDPVIAIDAVGSFRMR